MKTTKKQWKNHQKTERKLWKNYEKNHQLPENHQKNQIFARRA